jgi:hypothetical protein
MIKLDTNRAWQAAHAAILRNRETVLAVAGVFFFLPALAFALLYPQPPAATTPMAPEQAADFFRKFYLESLPYVLAMTAAQTVGAMAILRLFVQSSGATVGDALGKSVVDTLVFFAAMLMVGIATGIGLTLVVALGVATGVQAVAALAAAIAFGAMLYVWIRVLLAMPAIAVEGIRNPVAAVQRSWALTRGNTARIVLFLLLLMLAYMVIVGVATLVLGLVLALILGTKSAGIAVGIVTSALGTVFLIYLYTSLAAIHRQLAGPTAADIGTTFD